MEFKNKDELDRYIAEANHRFWLKEFEKTEYLMQLYTSDGWVKKFGTSDSIMLQDKMVELAHKVLECKIELDHCIPELIEA